MAGAGSAGAGEPLPAEGIAVTAGDTTVSVGKQGVRVEAGPALHVTAGPDGVSVGSDDLAVAVDAGGVAVAVPSDAGAGPLTVEPDGGAPAPPEASIPGPSTTAPGPSTTAPPQAPTDPATGPVEPSQSPVEESGGARSVPAESGDVTPDRPAPARGGLPAGVVEMPDAPAARERVAPAAAGRRVARVAQRFAVPAPARATTSVVSERARAVPTAVRRAEPAHKPSASRAGTPAPTRGAGLPLSPRSGTGPSASASGAAAGAAAAGAVAALVILLSLVVYGANGPLHPFLARRLPLVVLLPLERPG